MNTAKRQNVRQILRVVQTQAILFLKQCRKWADPTYNDSEFT